MVAGVAEDEDGVVAEDEDGVVGNVGNCGENSGVPREKHEKLLSGVQKQNSETGATRR